MGGNLPPLANYDAPAVEDIQFGTANPVGTVNVGDYLVFSGHNVVPTALAAGNAAAVRASGAGIALEASPRYDRYGATAVNTGLLYGRQGRFRVSAYNNINASAGVTLGAAAYPATTGSGVNAPTGLTGLGAQWATAARVLASGATAGAALGLATVVGLTKIAGGYGATGSGVAQLDILLLPPNPAYV